MTASPPDWSTPRIAFGLLPDEFTARQLRLVREALTGCPVTHENTSWRLMANRRRLDAAGRYRGGQSLLAALYRLPREERVVGEEWPAAHSFGSIRFRYGAASARSV